MSTIFNVRNLKLPSVPRATAIVGAMAVALALIGGIVGYRVYQALNNTTVVAYFSQALALYPGDKVQIMGFRVGSIDSIDPAGDKMKVTFHVDNKYKVPGRNRIGPQPQPGRLPHPPVVTALYRRTGHEGRCGDPARAHPGAS